MCVSFSGTNPECISVHPLLKHIFTNWMITESDVWATLSCAYKPWDNFKMEYNINRCLHSVTLLMESGPDHVVQNANKTYSCHYKVVQQQKNDLFCHILKRQAEGYILTKMPIYIIRPIIHFGCWPSINYRTIPVFLCSFINIAARFCSDTQSHCWYMMCNYVFVTSELTQEC